MNIVRVRARKKKKEQIIARPQLNLFEYSNVPLLPTRAARVSTLSNSTAGCATACSPALHAPENRFTRAKRSVRPSDASL